MERERRRRRGRERDRKEMREEGGGGEGEGERGRGGEGERGRGGEGGDRIRRSRNKGYSAKSFGVAKSFVLIIQLGSGRNLLMSGAPMKTMQQIRRL